MGRHCIAVAPRKVVVGWNLLFRSFFLQVMEAADNDREEATLLRVGLQPGALPAVADLESALTTHSELTSHAQLTPELRERLEADALQEPGYPLTGYVIDLKAIYSVAVQLRSGTALKDFMSGPVHRARTAGREIRITNARGEMIFHIKDGTVV